MLLAAAPSAPFLSPDRLLEESPAADLVLVDEAAAIPLPMLRRLRRLYPRLVMATTCGGYEGTGGGFRLRFVDALAGDLVHFELTRPVRWRDGDALEAWLRDSLLLDLPPAQPSADDAPVDYDIDTEIAIEPAREAYALLAAAHYRSRPSDLRRLIDEADQVLVVARRAGRIVGVAWLAAASRA